MKTIRDLIEIPEVETVIQVSSIAECDEQGRKSRFVDTFVITDDIMEGLHAVFTALSRSHGSGFLLKGGYGSGKSHFIAFVTSLLLHPHLANQSSGVPETIRPLITSIAARAVLPVYVTLTEYPATSALSDLLIDAISDALVRANLRNPLAESAGLADDFARIMLPGLKAQFDQYCANKKISNFNQLGDIERNIAVLQFLKECNIPFRPHYDYRDLFARIETIVAEKFPGGLFLLVDELSEFLRARSRPELISEDIRFIQFLGEQASRAKLWVLFSMQEAIEEVADISTEGLNRVKDRFPVRINLTAFHLRELVEKRLLRKKSDALGVIDEIHSTLSDSFAKLKLSREEFRAIYPIHPATFTMLESIAGLFSKTRGLVDFIVTEIAGDPKRSIAGMLNEPAQTLLLPDRIFDHFRNNLQESVQYNRMISIIFDSVERAIPSHFKKSNDADVALRAAKLIVLHQILPDKKSPSALELANLLVENRFTVDPDINYTFMREKIMKGLEQIWPFLRCERGATPLEDRFYLTGEESPLNRFEKSAQQFLQTVPHPDKQALMFFISRLRDQEIPLAEIKTGDHTARLQFENTVREGIVLLKSPASFSGQEIETLHVKLTRSEHDFAIIIGFPVQESSELERFRELCASIAPPFCETVFFWKPKVPDERERQAIRGHFARLRVSESGNVPLEDKSVRDRVEEAKREGTRIIKSLYAEGTLYAFADGAIKPRELLFTTSFDKTAELFARDAIKRAFPAHSKIMPTVPVNSTETYHQIIMLFREKSEIDFNFEGSRIIKNAADCLLKGSGIFSIIHSQYKVAPEPSKNPFIKDLLHAIEGNSLSFDELYLNFRKGRYGIQKELFCLYLFFLSSAGYLTLKRGGRTLRTSSLDLRTIQSADEILPGEELSPLFVEKYHLLGPFAEGLKPKDIHLQAQEAVWDKIVTFKRLEEDRIANLVERIDALERFAIFSKNPLTGIKASLERIIAFMKRIKTGKSSRDGFNELLADLPDDIHLENDLAVIKRFEQFLNVYLDQVIFIYNYLTSPELYPGDNEDLKSGLLQLMERLKELDTIIATGVVESLIESFSSFREEYKRHYQALHAEIHHPHALTEYEQIRFTPAYRVLANLGLIEVIAVPHDIRAVEQTLASLENSICRRQVAKELNEKPYCDCRLRREKIDISPNDIREMIRRGISEYFSALHSEQHSEKLIAFCGALLSSGDAEKRDMLKALLDTNPADTTDTDMLRTVTREAALLCNRALSANIQIVEKNVDELILALSERRGGRADIIRIFSEWLDKDITPGKEILYYLKGTRDKERTHLIPDIAMEGLKKLFPGKNEDIALQALTLCHLPPRINGDETHPLVKAMLHLEVTGKALKQFQEAYGDFIPPDIVWEHFFSPDAVSELIAVLNLDEKTTVELASIFNAAKGFPSIRGEIIARIVSGTIQIGKKDESLFISDETVQSEILVSALRHLSARKNFFRESARSEKFNGALCQWAFAAIREADTLHHLSVNRNILTERIAVPALASKHEIEEFCAKLFAEKISEWENDPEASIMAIHTFFNETNAPVILLFDALRYDLFLAIAPLFEKSGFIIKQTDFYLSPLPSDTLTFRQFLFPEIELESGLEFEYGGKTYVFLHAAERDYKRENLRSLLNNTESALILSIGLLDEKIHSTTLSVPAIAGEMGMFCEQTLLPLLSDVSKDRELIICNDHGFIEHPDFAQRSQPRYTHGGNTFFERTIFACRLRKR